MVKVKNLHSGMYLDGVLVVQPGEVVEVSEQKAAYLCSAECPVKFERVEEVRQAKPVAATRPAVTAKKGKD